MTATEQELSLHDTIIGVPKEIQKIRAQLILILLLREPIVKE